MDSKGIGSEQFTMKTHAQSVCPNLRDARSKDFRTEYFKVQLEHDRHDE